MQYDVITEQEFNDLERQYSSDKNSVPRKRFVAKTERGYLAMDNSCGEGFVEECSSKVLIEEFFSNGLGYDDESSHFSQIRHQQAYY